MKIQFYLMLAALSAFTLGFQKFSYISFDMKTKSLAIDSKISPLSRCALKALQNGEPVSLMCEDQIEILLAL